MQRRTLLLLPPLLLLGAAAGEAHAFLDHAAPPVNGTLASAPKAVRLWFSEPLEPAFSTVQVFDAAGKRVDTGRPPVSSDDGRELLAALKPLAAGSYRVIWRAVSVDTHVTTGDFLFHIAN